jgi:hypothetical protein
MKLKTIFITSFPDLPEPAPINPLPGIALLIIMIVEYNLKINSDGRK